MNYTALKERRAQLIEHIRMFSEAQSELWQLVPWLALQANGRSGYNDNFSRAYVQGFWALESSNRYGGYTVYVDCATGTLVSPYAPHGPAPDDTVIALRLIELNVEQLVQRLRDYANEPVSQLIHQRPEGWRERMAEQFGIQPVYTRTERAAPVPIWGD